MVLYIHMHTNTSSNLLTVFTAMLPYGDGAIQQTARHCQSVYKLAMVCRSRVLRTQELESAARAYMYIVGVPSDHSFSLVVNRL